MQKIFEHEFLDLKELQTVTINGKRHYQVGEEAYPSVTTALSGTAKPALEAWKKRVGESQAIAISNAAKTRGTKFHALVEQYILNKETSLKSALPTTIELFHQVKPVLDQRIGKVYGIEAPVYSHQLRVAGRFDFAADFDGEASIIDFKTATRPKKWQYMHGAFMQEASYSYMVYERTGLYVPKLVTIVLCGEAQEAQIFIEKSSAWLPKAVETIEEYHKQNG